MSATAYTEKNAPVKKLLVVEDDPALREALVDTLLLAEYRVESVNDAESALLVLKQNNDIEMIISDVNMGQMSGHDLLKQVSKDYPHIPMLLMTAYGSIRDSVDAIRLGAVDYLVKPFEPKALINIVAKYTGKQNLVSNDAPVAEAAASIELLNLAKRVAQTDSTVLVVGESGTGKEVLARYIHDQSPRADQAFVAINCAAIPENMLEAILFGYEKGAYTGAYASAPGKFEQANGGTLLLDEISEMDLGLQAKLLRVIQEREVERLGGRKAISLDVRIIATSNRQMQEQVMAGKFREDLYYRLSVLPLQWLPLRERKEDIIPLAERLLHKHSQKQNRLNVVLTTSAKQAILTHPWMGNVRELDNVMQRALILQTGLEIHANDLGLDFGMSNDNVSQYKLVMNQSVSSVVTEVSETIPKNNEKPLLGDDLKQREFEIIADTLKEENGSRKRTAERLGISARTLRYKLARMRDMGLDIKQLVEAC